MRVARTLGVVMLAGLLTAGASALSGQTPAAPTEPYTGAGPGGSARIDPGRSLIANPYRMVEAWPRLNPGMKWAPTVSFLPDNAGGLLMLFRASPPLIRFDAAGAIAWMAGHDVEFEHAHGLCRDRDGNLWAGDSGPSLDNPKAAGKGFLVHKFSPEGRRLLTLGQPGISKAGPDTFLGPAACIELPDGDILIADGHWPRPSTAQQDGDRLVRVTRDGRFVRAYGKLGKGPGEFMGPHALALDSQGRLFVADRSNNRIQIFDRDMTYLDSWKHFGRPSGLWILKDDTLFVADSESGGLKLGGPAISAEGPAPAYRNVGWKQGVWIGSARDGSIRGFIDGINPEGMAADEQGNVFVGLTAGCPVSRSGGCVQKWVRK